MKILKRSVLTSMCCVMYVANVYSQENSQETNEPGADQRLFRLGIGAGVSYPPMNRFKHKKSDNNILLKKATNYSATIGYSFYPQMALEFVANYQPQYDLNYILPIYLTSQKISGNAKVKAQIYNLNLVYDLKEYIGLTPYIGGGIGIAHLAVKATDLRSERQNIFKTKSDSQNFFTWQAKLGATKNITNNLVLNLGGQLQKIQRVKLNYAASDLTNNIYNFGTIKKTLCNFQLSAGIILKIPVKG
ncbi:MAG: porin family protein [Rickettsiaceae bacterium]|nr:MAG: porin family protein [Rickettsiaceae bacterium]